MKYTVTATYVFENIEADCEEWAQELVDVNSLKFYISHPTELGTWIHPDYEVFLQTEAK